MTQLKQQREAEQAPREEAPSAIESVPAFVAKPEPVKESLSYNDIEIVRALAEDSYVYGNLAGLTDKTGLARELISARLPVLKSMGVIETRINEKSILHWCVSSKGKQMLDEILSGQEEH